MPTIDKPSMVSIKSSGSRNERTIGLAIIIKNVKTIAPNMPPNNDDTKAADNALAACPFLDKGKPSNIVA